MQTSGIKMSEVPVLECQAISSRCRHFLKKAVGVAPGTLMRKHEVKLMTVVPKKKGTNSTGKAFNQAKGDRP